MSDYIEVEIENKSYLKLLNLEDHRKKIIKLTTIEDNQSSVIIKIFLNKSGEKFFIKEFNVRNLQPKKSGLSRFKLSCQYKRKWLNLELMVDGKKFENFDLNLSKFFRNNKVLLYIFAGILILLVLIFGGRCLLTKPGPDITQDSSRETISKPVTEETETKIPKELPLVEKTENNLQDSTRTTVLETVKEEVQSAVEAEKSAADTQIITTFSYTAYFGPNDTVIMDEAVIILEKLAETLIKHPEVQVIIEGHCALTGTEPGREILSQERAYNILSYLKKKGWTPEIDPIIRWFGGTQPVTLNEEEIYRNRRVEITIVSP
jgi:outer membrane protein OmpA-like peptidoglycan-associated protein